MKPLFFLLLSFCFFSCAVPRFNIPVRTKLVADTLPPLPTNAELIYVNLYEQVPAGSKFLRKLEVGGNTFWGCPACNYELVLAEAGVLARQTGANIVKVIKPRDSRSLSVCPRVTFGLFRNDDAEAIAAYQREHEAVNASSLPADADYAVIHFYRPADLNGIIPFPVFYQKTRIGLLGNNRKFSFQTTNFGPQRFEIANSPFPIDLNVEPGQEYYLTYHPTTGAEAGIPGLRLVDNIVGREETKTARPYIPKAARSSR